MKKTEMASLADRKQILGLDLVRFWAAASVMVYHFAFCSWANPTSPARGIPADFSSFSPLASYSNFGWVGVQLFFVISGFVISYTAEGASPMRFLRSRILRLAPGVWLCTAITVAVIILFVHPLPRGTLRETIGSILFDPIGPWISGVYWTLGVEVMFYALVFAILSFDRFHWLEPVMVVLGLLSTLFWVADYVAVGAAGSAVHHLARNRLGQLLLLQHGCFFASGSLLWLTLLKRVSPARLLVLAALGVGCVLQVVAEAKMTAEWMHTPVAAWPAVVAWLVGVGALTISVIANPRLQKRAARYATAVRQIGLYTFPLYLIHDVAGVLALGALLRLNIYPIFALLVACALMIALSATALLGEKALQARLRGVLLMLERKLPMKLLPFLFRTTRGLDFSAREEVNLAAAPPAAG